MARYGGTGWASSSWQSQWDDEASRRAENRRKRETDAHVDRNSRTDRLLSEVNVQKALREECQARQFMHGDRETRQLSEHARPSC